MKTQDRQQNERIALNFDVLYFLFFIILSNKFI